MGFMINTKMKADTKLTVVTWCNIFTELALWVSIRYLKVQSIQKVPKGQGIQKVHEGPRYQKGT